MKKYSIPSYIFLALLAGVAIFPVLFVISNSFMSSAEIISRYSAEILPANEADFASRGVHFVRVGLLPERFDLGQYRELFLKSPGYLRMFWNSVAIVIPVLLGQTILAPLTAYGFERVMWKHKEALFLVYIVIMLMPAQLLLVPNFVVAAYSGQCARDYITGGVSPAWRGAHSAAVEKFSDLLHRSCSAGRRGGVPNVQTDRAAKFVLGRGGVDRFALCG